MRTQEAEVRLTSDTSARHRLSTAILRQRKLSVLLTMCGRMYTTRRSQRRGWEGESCITASSSANQSASVTSHHTTLSRCHPSAGPNTIILSRLRCPAGQHRPAKLKVTRNQISRQRRAAAAAAAVVVAFRQRLGVGASRRDRSPSENGVGG